MTIPPIDETLRAACIRSAMEARRRAYAPYSHFAVGAALLTASGRIFTGCNVENASYPATICAERAAVAAAIAAGERTFLALAVCGSRAGYTTPCGICRQVLAEFSVPAVYCVKTETDYLEISGEELLPHTFTKDSLQEKV